MLSLNSPLVKPLIAGEIKDKLKTLKLTERAFVKWGDLFLDILVVLAEVKFSSVYARWLS